MKQPIGKAAIFMLVALMLVGCSKESPEKQLQSAKDYLGKNDPKAATIQLKNALQARPDLGEGRFLLGTILLREGNPSAAEIEFRKAIAAKYADSVVVPELARALLVQGQDQKVIEEFGATQLDTPVANANLQTSLASAYDLLDKPDLAQVALSAALAADPTYARALVSSARHKAVLNQFDDAIGVLDGVTAKDAKNAEAWKLKGDILLLGKKNPTDALAAYRKSVEAEPTFWPGQIAIMTVLLQQQKLDEASAQLAQLKKVAPNSLDNKYLEAQLAYFKKDYPAARSLCRELLGAAPSNPRFLQLAGATELQMKSLPQAETYLTSALQAAPGYGLARRMLIATYLRSGQPAKALTTLEAGAGKIGNDPAMLSLAGEVYLQNGDAAKAEASFAQALKLDPDNAPSRTALAISHLAAGQTESGFDELQAIAGSDSGITADLALISGNLSRKQYDKALAAVDKLEAKQPDKPLAASLRGQIQVLQNNGAVARKSFERSLSIDPSYFPAMTGLAALDMADKKPDDAKKRFEALLKSNPNNEAALLATAQIALTSGEPKDKVAGILLKAVEAAPNDARPRLLLIDLWLKNKDNKQAVSVAEAGVAALPNSPELLAALGRAEQVSGDVNQAIATYTKLIALQPQSPQPHVRLAEAYMDAKNKQAAEQSLHDALEIQPDLLDAQRGLIILALDAKRFQDAVKIAQTVQSQRPKSPVGFSLDGDIAAAQKDWGAAAADYRSGLQRAASPDMAIKLHTTLNASGKALEADKFAATWVKDHPTDAIFVFYLGDTALARHDLGAAQKDYASVLRIQPDNAIALNNVAWVMGQLGQDGAVAYAEKATKLAPNQPSFMDTLALLLADRGEYARAIELQSKAIQLQPSAGELKLDLAKIYIKAGDKGRARTELETLSRLGDTFSSQSEVSALLKTL